MATSDPQLSTDNVCPTLQSRLSGFLHLTPCTLQKYQNLDHRPDDRYELVDGFLMSKPREPDEEHQNLSFLLPALLAYLPVEQRRKIEAYPEWSIILFERDNVVVVPNHAVEQTSAPVHPGESSSSKSPRVSSSADAGSSSQSGGTIRCPDFIVVERAEGSEASDIPISPFETNRRRTCHWKKAIMVGEITSTYSMKDFKDRSKEHRRDKIPEYIILDRQKLLMDRNPCVLVYKLNRRTGRYNKKVYTKDDKVDCSYFKYWKLTANQMLDHKHMRILLENERRKMEESNERADREKERADREKERADREKDRADREKGRADREKREKEREEERADHAYAFLRGEKKTPPRGLELHPSQLKIDPTTSSERGEASRSPSPPISPPHRVRKRDESDVKASSHKSGKGHRSGKKK